MLVYRNSSGEEKVLDEFDIFIICEEFAKHKKELAAWKNKQYEEKYMTPIQFITDCYRLCKTFNLHMVKVVTEGLLKTLE